MAPCVDQAEGGEEVENVEPAVEEEEQEEPEEEPEEPDMWEETFKSHIDRKPYGESMFTESTLNIGGKPSHKYPSAAKMMCTYRFLKTPATEYLSALLRSEFLGKMIF